MIRRMLPMLAAALVACGDDEVEMGDMEEVGEVEVGEPVAADQDLGRGAGMMGAGADWCPMALGDIEVEAEEMDGGAALEFETDDEAQRAMLRQRVQQMATMHTRHHAGAMGPGHMMGQGRQAGQRGGMGPGHMMGQGWRWADLGMPATTATYEETDEGARIVFLARDTSDAELLEERVEMAAEHMESGVCPMMGQVAE